MKKVLALMAIVAMIAVSSVAFAQETATVAASITDTTTFNADCDNDDTDDAGAAIKTFTTDGSTTTLALDLDDSGEMYCQIFADSNAALGFDVTIAGTDDGTADNGVGLTTGTLDWVALDDTTDDTVAAGAEEWGYKLTQTTAAASTGVTGAGNGVYAYTINTDSGHVNSSAYNVDDHTLNSTVDTIISEVGQVTDGAFFTTELSMATDELSDAGTYNETVTYTQVFN